MSENQIILDVTDYEVILTLRVPERKTLWLVSVIGVLLNVICIDNNNDTSFYLFQDYVLVVPESTYSPSFLSEEPLDKSYDFISSCGQNRFYIKYDTYTIVNNIKNSGWSLYSCLGLKWAINKSIHCKYYTIQYNYV